MRIVDEGLNGFPARRPQMAARAATTVFPAVIERLRRDRGLGDGAARTLSELCADKLSTMAARSVLRSEGEAPAFVTLLLSGWCCRYRTLSDGRRQILGFLLPGDFIELDQVGQQSDDHAVGALSAVIAAPVDRDEFGAALGSDPSIDRTLRLQAMLELSILREWSVSLGRRSALERISHLFCELQVRVGGWSSNDSATIDMPCNQTDVADAVGMTPVHVNRILHQLRELRAARWKTRMLTIADTAKLRQLCDFDPTYLRIG